MSGNHCKSVLAALMLVLASAPAFAQGTSLTSLTGVVLDEAGGAVPGATVTIKNNATGVSLEQISNSVGRFAFPSLDAGTYTVIIALSGFKTFVASEVRLLAATPGDITARLAIGNLTETVEVKASTELIQSTQTAVRSTLSVEQLTNIPLNSRNALYAVALLPGVATTGGPRGAVINGLPNNTVNITIDGLSTGNKLQSGDGFYSMVTPRRDPAEEITVTGAVPGANAGAGSVQVQFVTRSGSNQLTGSVYHYYRGPRLNTNYYFNEVNTLGKNEVIVHQYGGRAGGPILIPGVIDGRGKAFFFFNYERLNQPTSATRTRTFLRESAMTGLFRYGSNSVDLMALAASTGNVSTFDPTVISLLQQIQATTTTTGKVNDLGAGNTLQFVFQSPSVNDQYSPTTRIDVNLSNRHRLSGAYWLQRFTNTSDILNNADATFPGLPNFGSQNSWRTTGNTTLRSTLSSNVVNELRGGWQYSPNDFFANVTRDQFTNQEFHGLIFPNVNNVTSPTAVIAPAPRNTTTWNVENQLSWLRGAHSITMGGSYAGIFNRQNNYTVVPQINLGFDPATDPAAGMFSTSNLPGASTANLNEARALYALLTGRVTAIPANARLDAATGKYVYNGDLALKSRQSLFAAFVQDSWQVSPTLTLNAGMRWDLHLPFTTANRTFSMATLEDQCGISGIGEGPGGRQCNLFKPGVETGIATPTYDLFEPGTPAYNTNWNLFGPNIGVAWRPNVQNGLMRTLLGDPEQATVRAGYSLTYNQERIDRFTNNASDNPGGTLNVRRDLTTGFPLVLPGESAPVLYRERERLGPPSFPESPSYPISATTANNVNVFNPDLKNPRVHSYSVGFQRAVGSDMAVEVRYVGNQNRFTWAEENWNERNILENGFLDEFKLAQANLRSHVAEGCGTASNPAVCSFAYRGPGTGTSPLPIHLAYLSGAVDPNNPGSYSNASFTNSAFLARFSELEPQVGAAATAIDTSANRTRALAAGLPSNFFVMNPAVNGTFIVMDNNYTKFNSLQLELRRRLSRGLLISGNYTYGIRKGSLNNSLHFERMQVDTTDIPHAFKVNWIWQVPVGRGRRFGTDMNRYLDYALGGWEFSGNARFQTQRFRIVGARLEGMSPGELQDAFDIYITKNPDTGLTNVFSFPDDIRINTHKAFSTDPTTASGFSAGLGVPEGRYLAPASEPGCVAIWRNDCNVPDIHLNGPLFSRVDVRVKKLFPFLSRGSFELDIEFLNVFDAVNFNHSVGFNTAEVTDTFRVTTAFTDINTTFDPGGRIGQIVWRVNW